MRSIIRTSNRFTNIQIRTNTQQISRRTTRLMTLRISTLRTTRQTSFIRNFNRFFNKRPCRYSIVRDIFTRITRHHISQTFTSLNNRYFTQTHNRQRNRITITTVRFRRVIQTLTRNIMNPIRRFLISHSIQLNRHTFQLTVTRHTTASIRLLSRMVRTSSFTFTLQTTSSTSIRIYHRFTHHHIPILIRQAIVTRNSRHITNRNNRRLRLGRLITRQHTYLPNHFRLKRRFVSTRTNSQRFFSRSQHTFVFQKGRHMIAITTFTPRPGFNARTGILRQQVRRFEF